MKRTFRVGVGHPRAAEVQQMKEWSSSKLQRWIGEKKS